MRGGLSRRDVARCILVMAMLAMLAGCGTLFGSRRPAAASGPTPAELLDAELQVPPQPSSEALGSVIVTAPLHEPQEARRAPPKPVHRRPPSPPKAVPEAPPPPAPVAPQPIVASRLLSNETRGLLDARVQRPDGKVIGRAIDVFVDQNGKPIEMLVNLSGFMGIGDRKVRFPWSAFTFNMTRQKASVTLGVAPGQPPAAGALGKKAARVAGGTGASGLMGLIDVTVERPDGSRVGRVTDVLIDNHAQPQAAVVDVGSLIHDRRRIAADWSALRFVPKSDDGLTVRTDLTDAQIQAAPAFEPDQPVRAVSPSVAPRQPATPAAPQAR